MNWHNLSKEDIFIKTNSRLSGLTSAECNKRLKEDGMNELPKKKSDTIFQIMIKQLIEPIVLLMIVAAIFSFLINEVVDGYAIIFIILADLILGTIQEYNAFKNALALSNMIRVKTRVRRSDIEFEIDSKNIAVGDIVLLSSGDKITADMRILESTNLSVDESILTGESHNVNKLDTILDEKTSLAERKNMVYAGTSVTSGRAIAIVINTGINTEIGKIADKVTNTKETKSPLTIRMEKFSKQIAFLIVIIAILIFLLLYIKKMDAKIIFLSVIALLVSAMPEGLPLALTMALTIASNRMAKKKVIVKKLNSVESLGSCTVIASDKTGTLTVNEQTAKKILLPDNQIFEIEGVGYSPTGSVIGKNLSEAYFISELGVINNEADLELKNNEYEFFGDSIDVAFLTLGKKLNVDISNIQIIDEIPYESVNKYSAVFYKKDEKTYVTAKGSPEKILSFCTFMRFNGEIKNVDKDYILKQNDNLAREGYRVIALAYSKTNEQREIKNLIFAGLVAFIDPIRDEVKTAIRECKTAGIKVKMITGDHPLTAFKIAKELGLATTFDEVATTFDIEEMYKKGIKEFDSYINSKNVFARVTPIDKLDIVNSYKRMGEFIAVTGDGVNDAPAIRAANIGIAMGSGSDVAKETANMIITDDNFNFIVEGIKEGRNAYSNIRKVSYMLLSCGLAEVLFFILSVIFNYDMPLIAVQLLWLNMVTDGLQDFALSFEKAENSIMEETPRKPNEAMFDKTLLLEVLISGLVMSISVFGVWVYLLNVAKLDVKSARAYIMMLMVFMQNMHVLNCRSEKKSIFKTPLKTNPLVIFSIVSAIILEIIVSEVPLFSKMLKINSIPFIHMIILFMISLSILVVMEIYKKLN